MSRNEIQRFIDEKLDLLKVAEEYKSADREIMGDYAKGYEESMVEDIAYLTVELKDKLVDYGVIISDDASARLPSLFFRRLINKEKDKKKMSHVETYFIASGRHDVEDVYRGIKDYLKEKVIPNQRVLLVSEYIDTGRSINRICRILDELGVDYDLAAVSSADPIDDGDSYSRYPEMKKHLISGGCNLGGLHFHDNRGGGVKKDVHYMGKPVKDKIHPKRITKGDVDDQRRMNAVRKNINDLADKLSPLLE
ncbi:MAG: hypothetical protein WC517_00410 [Patescibacteria group bacterium]